MKQEKFNIAIRNLREMQLNYKEQYPKKIPNMDLIIDIVLWEIAKEISEMIKND